MAQVFGFISVLVFLSNFSSMGPNGLMAFLTAFKTCVFLGSLGLKLTRVSKREVVGLNYVLVPILVLLTGFVFFFFRQWSIALWALGVDLPSPGG